MLLWSPATASERARNSALKKLNVSHKSFAGQRGSFSVVPGGHRGAMLEGSQGIYPLERDPAQVFRVASATH